MEPQGIVPELAAQVGTVLSVEIPHSSDAAVDMLHQQTIVTVDVTESDSQTEPTIATIELPLAFQPPDPTAETNETVQEVVKVLPPINPYVKLFVYHARVSSRIFILGWKLPRIVAHIYSM